MKIFCIKCRRGMSLFMCVFAALFFSNCRKFVQTNVSKTQISSASVFSDNNAATAALTVVYSQMQSESWYMSQMAGLLSDELQSPSSSSDVYLPYTNSATALNSIGPWTRAYNYIYEMNAVIENLTNSISISTPVRTQLIGEAEFVRAFWHFYLASCYGDIPYVTSIDYKINSYLVRTPQNVVYDNIIKDLKDAEGLLNSGYVDFTDTVTKSVDRIRPNKATAAALLARVYLYAQKYQEAEIESASLLADSRYGLVALDQVFLANSHEAIWQLGMPTPSYYNTVDAFYFILQAAPDPYGSSNTVTISPWLWNSFEPNDNRKSHWIDSFVATDPDTVTYYFPYKYKNTSPNPIEYTMMFRLAEQYLIHAEALVKQKKDLSNAIDDINTIRMRAGLLDYSGPPANVDSIMSAIMHERQTELFTEWGHRWFDLVRTGNVDPVMRVVTPLKGGQAWRPEWALLPIPFGEIQLDHNLTQNPGY